MADQILQPVASLGSFGRRLGLRLHDGSYLHRHISDVNQGNVDRHCVEVVVLIKIFDSKDMILIINPKVELRRR